MDWQISRIDRTEEDPTGIGRFIMRMDRALRDGGPPIQGFQFLSSGKEMMRVTREIEDELAGISESAELYVGFQKAEKFDREAGRYHELIAGGVQVIAFGQGTLEETGRLPQWVDVQRDVNALENQWFLVTRSPEPIAFIGWEVSEPSMFGVGGISTPGKQFAGFISSDERVVNAIIAYLDQVRTSKEPAGAATDLPIIDGPVSRILAVTSREPEPEIAVAVQAAAELALGYSAELVLYDISAGSYLVSSHDSRFSRRRSRILSPSDLDYLGRGFIGQQVQDMEAQGIPSGAIIPSRNGFDHMAKIAGEEDVDIIIVPEHFSRPSLMQRIRKQNLFVLLDNIDIPVLQCDEEGALKAEMKPIPLPVSKPTSQFDPTSIRAS